MRAMCLLVPVLEVGMVPRRIGRCTCSDHDERKYTNTLLILFVVVAGWVVGVNYVPS